METKPITVKATINGNKTEVWKYYTSPEHITQWNFADKSWHCPKASNNMKVGGTYFARMEAKDGSFGFDFEAIYTNIVHEEQFSYEFGGRTATVVFKDNKRDTDLIVTFDPETENSLELQKNGWQAILNNFKAYVEAKL